MIKDFVVYSRQAMEGCNGQRSMPHIIVSITTPGDPYAPAKIKTNENTLGILRLSFYDLDRVEPGVEELECDLFQPSQAKEILTFVDAHPTAERFIVHCDAGLSRSPAVAAALSKILYGDDSRFFRQYHPNMLVYRSILDAHYNKENEDGTNESSH